MSKVRASLLAFVCIAILSTFSFAESPQVITIHAKKFAFDPAEITVQKGKPVQLVLIADDVPHGLVVPDLNIQADLPRHKSIKVNFTPQKTGDFAGMCSHYCGINHGAMKFIVHVVDAGSQ